MKRFFLFILIVVTLIVDYAALDDITTGSETDLRTEFVTLAVSVFVIAFSIYLLKKGYKNVSHIDKNHKIT